MAGYVTAVPAFVLRGLPAWERNFYSQTGLSMARVLVYDEVYREKRAKDLGPCVDSNSQTSVPQRSALPMTPQTRRCVIWCIDGINLFISCAIHRLNTAPLINLFGNKYFAAWEARNICNSVKTNLLRFHLIFLFFDPSKPLWRSDEFLLTLRLLSVYWRVWMQKPINANSTFLRVRPSSNRAK